MQESNNTKHLNIWTPFLLSIMMLGGMLVGTKLQPPSQNTQIVFENTDGTSQAIGQGRVEELIRYIQAKYVDTVNTEQLVESAITSLFKDLDPHSVYMSASQVERANEQLDGSFVGIGIEYLLIGDTVSVLNIMPDGPAAQAGIQVGDRIVEAVNLDVKSTDVAGEIGIVKKLRGKRNSKVALTIKRRGENESIRKIVTRNRIIVSSVDIHYMLDDETGYIKLNKFSSNTITEFMDALDDLVTNEGMKNLVFDLRQNGGGYLREAIKILNQIFPDKDQKLVYTIGKNVKKEEFFSTGRNVFDIDKVYVLIDESSASASEIVAGAIQDWDRGLIIGRRSYGKGLVQEQYDLKDGSALRLTVARYYTPAGRLIQRDYTKKDEYDKYLENRINSGEFTNLNQVAVPDSSKFYTANGRQVYAGGGITPDIYVPYDSLLLNSYYQSLLGSIPEFAFKYVENNNLSYSEDEFIRNFQLDDLTVSELENFHSNNSAKSITEMPLSKPAREELFTGLKARIGRNLFGDLAFYKILNNDDPVIAQAIRAKNSYSQLTHNQ